MLLISFLFFIILIIIFLSIVLYYALKRINQYENLIINIQTMINTSTQRMKQIDSLGHYESDDETSFFFKQLKEIQLMLDGLFEPTLEEDDAEKKEK
tara:strand:+ start:576 stop:866 length:291 start_codon:yes stop_codon:yes gene_type:complete